MNATERSFLNLELLAKISEELGARCFFLVFGGFAIDGILGKMTRPHKDIDLLCFRRDAREVRSGLRRVGFDMTDTTHPQDHRLTYKMVSGDEHKTCTCHILDEVFDNHFEISFYHFLRQRFPLCLLAYQSITLHHVTYPVPTKEFLILLKKQENVFLNELKKKDSEKYLRRKKRHSFIKRDLNLLNNL